MSRKMSLRVVFTPGLKRTLLFLTPTLKGPNKRFPFALLSRGLTLIVQENSRNGLLLPRVPGHAPPLQGLVNISTAWHQPLQHL